MNQCVLDEQRFAECCQLLLQQSQRLKDGWSWESVQGSEEGYLKKTTVRSVTVDSRSLWDHCETENLGAEADGGDEDDGLPSPPESGSLVLQYEYHVVYSCSYGTPVLYFRASSLEGRSLSLEDVWRSVHPSFRARLQRNPLSTISLQQEHPLLGQPFFMLHPCKTEEFMRPVLQDQHRRRPVNYVLVWLSVVGPLVGSGRSSHLFHAAAPSG
uniref:Ubiquitin-like-conjugating enzyme ATG10 n=1 Tax=Tetraodon nigroviridis TaxID=99883 RepID=H3CCM4_TETNG